MDNMIKGPRRRFRRSTEQTPIPGLPNPISTGTPPPPEIPEQPTLQQVPQQPPLDAQPAPQEAVPEPPRRRRRLRWSIFWIITMLVAGILVVGIWANSQLSAVNPNDTSRTLIEVEPGSGISQVATTLSEASLIKDRQVFMLYLRLTGVESDIKAGNYRLSPSESVAQIVEHLTKGNVDTFSITFLPGATLEDHRKVLLTAGYEDDEIDEAFAANYEGLLFAGKPPSADLEGYIYGETYQASSGATVEDILKQTFSEYERVIEENNLVTGFAGQQLSLYEGITMASIIQRESIGGDEPQIAQVFLLRLNTDMVLGSDVTYQYIADKTGVARDVNLDSPYNTRRYAGLPPGPISSPGVAALTAVAKPAAGDYLFFLSGDDDITYFARTLAEHEANIQEHCKVKCQII